MLISYYKQSSVQYFKLKYSFEINIFIGKN